MAANHEEPPGAWAEWRAIFRKWRHLVLEQLDAGCASAEDRQTLLALTAAIYKYDPDTPPPDRGHQGGG